MPAKWNPGRRRLLTAAALAAPAISCSARKSPWRYLTATEGETAAAVCECLIPTDEFPGATWAGAVNFIDLQLCGHFRKFQNIYRDGLAALDTASRQAHGQPFPQLAPEQQVELLRSVEKGKSPENIWKPARQKEFFKLILTHTQQSYYGDPRHGGNRDEVGYRSLGIPATPVRGRSHHDASQADAAVPEKRS